jgi:hypothetical protein
LLQADRFQRRLKRQVFTERHQVNLVVQRRQAPFLAKDHQAVEDASLRAAARRRVDAEGAGSKLSALRQQPADGFERLRPIQRQKRHCSLGPNDEGNAGRAIHCTAAGLRR